MNRAKALMLGFLACSVLPAHAIFGSNPTFTVRQVQRERLSALILKSVPAGILKEMSAALAPGQKISCLMEPEGIQVIREQSTGVFVRMRVPRSALVSGKFGLVLKPGTQSSMLIDREILNDESLKKHASPGDIIEWATVPDETVISAVAPAAATIVASEAYHKSRRELEALKKALNNN